MKILLVTSEMIPGEGDPPGVVAGRALALAARGHEVTVAATVAPGAAEQVRAAWPQLAAAKRVRLELFQRNRPTALGMSRRFNAFVRREIAGFDVLHVHRVWEHCLAYAAAQARRHGVPYVVTPQGMLDERSRRRSPFQKALARGLLGTQRMLDGADALQFGSAGERDEAEDAVTRGNPHVIAEGVGAAPATVDRDFARQQVVGDFPQLEGAEPLVLCSARLHPEKGADVLLEAVARQPESVKLLVAGLPDDAAYEARLRRRAAADDLKDRVAVTTDYTGARRQLALAAADVFALPSHEEGFSAAVVEAMALGLPLLLSDRCHMDVVAEVGAGKVAPATPAGQASALWELVSAGAERRAEMGRNARQWFLDNCTWDRIAEQLESMYRELAKKR